MQGMSNLKKGIGFRTQHNTNPNMGQKPKGWLQFYILAVHFFFFIFDLSV
jgi:hypothetical protein